MILGEKLRYAHGAGNVHAALRAAALDEVTFTEVSTRRESGVPVPGLLVVAQQAARPLPPLDGEG